MRYVVWLKDDIRLEDNPAVSLAMREAGAAYVTFIRSREGIIGHVRATQRRRQREQELLKSIKNVVENAGSRLIECPGDAESIVKAIVESGANTVIANIQISDNLEHHRDRKVRKLLKAAGITYREMCVDGIGRGSRQAPPPFLAGTKDHPWFNFQETPDPIRRLRSFLTRLPDLPYREHMWIPGKDEHATSRMSVDVACGGISIDRILHETEQASKKSGRYSKAWYQFASRAHWRRSFVQLFEQNIDHYPWKPLREETPEDMEKMNRWKAGETGYPLVDAAMRQLQEEGWANFRMRQIVCSFAIDLLDLDPYRVGVELGNLFDDYTPGIHWMQIARQSGMMVGVGPRVVNPIKQASDLDPEGQYVRRWIPELERVPATFIFEPWKWEGYKGPAPIVEYKQAAREARERRHPPASPKETISSPLEKNQLSLF